MARQGSFTYGGSSGGKDLTSLIKSLYDQQQSAEQTAMFDAWQNGGEVDGKPVNDARILAYIKSRQAEYGKTDPLFAQWGEKLLETQFAIGEQKATLSYRQTNNASAMADFYKSWIGKVPADSAFGRSIATSAAQWAKSAAGAARSRASSRASSALNATATAAQNAANSWGAIDNALTVAAQRAGFISGTQTIEDASGENIRTLFASGVINPATGKAITESEWRAGAVNYYNALGSYISIAQANGRSTKTWTDARNSFLKGTIVRQNAVDFQAQYDAARQNFDQADNACQGDPMCSLRAAQDYKNTLSGIVSNAEKLPATGVTSIDPTFIGGLNNEIAALSGQSPQSNSQGDKMFQGPPGSFSTPTDLANGYAKAVADAQALASGNAYYGQKTPGGALGVYPAPTGIGGAMPSDLQKSVIMGADGQPKVAWLSGQAIHSAILLDHNGNALNVDAMSAEQIQQELASGQAHYSSSDTSVIGYVFQNPANGSRVWGVPGANGQLTFTDTNPFGAVIGGYVPAGQGNLIPKVDAQGKTTGYTISPTSFAPNVQGTSILTDPSLTSQDLQTIINANPQEFGAAGQQLVANITQRNMAIFNARQAQLVAASNTQTGNVVPQTGPQLSPAALAPSGSHPYGPFDQQPAPTTATQSASHPYGPYGAQVGPPPTSMGPLAPSPTREIAGGAYEMPTIKIPNVQVPTAPPPPIRQANATSPQDVVPGPKPPTPVAPPTLTPPPPIPQAESGSAQSDSGLIAPGPKTPSAPAPAPTGGGGSKLT